MPQDLQDVWVTHHLPQAIRTEQYGITQLEWLDERIDLDHWFGAKTAVNLVPLGMGVDVIGLDNASLHQIGNQRMILRDLAQSFGCSIQVGAAISNIRYKGGQVDDQGRGDGGPHFHTL